RGRLPAAPRPAPSQPARLRRADRRLDARPGRRGGARRGPDRSTGEHRADPPGAEAAGRRLEARQGLDHQPRPGVPAQNGARDRLIRLAQRHADWVLGYQDETWGSRLARPAMHAWADEPLRLRQLEADGGDPDPKALACYGLLRADTGR